MAAGSAGGLGCVSTSTPHVFNPKMAEPLKISFQLLDPGSVTSKFNLQGSVPMGHKMMIDWAEILSHRRVHARVTGDQ